MKRGSYFLEIIIIYLILIHLDLSAQLVEFPYDYSSKRYFEAKSYFNELSIRRAEKELIDIVKKDSFNPIEDKSIILQANILFLTGDYKNADAKLSEFFEQLSNSPLKAHAALLRAYIKFEYKKYNLAAEYFQKAEYVAENEFEIRGDSIYRILAQNAIFWGAISYCQLGKFSESRPYLEKCFRAYPDLNFADDALYTLAVTEEINRNYSLAINYYNTIFKNYPYRNTYVASRIREINNKLLLRKPHSAIDILTNTQNVLAHIAVKDSIGMLYEKQSFVNDATSDLQYLEGEAQNIAGNYEQALSEFQTYMDTYSNPELINYVRLGAAWSLLNLNRNKEAIKLYDKILESDDDNYRTSDAAKLYRAVAYKRSGDMSKATKEFSSLSIQPAYTYLGQALLELGQIYYESGQFTDAKRILERAKRESRDNIVLIRVQLLLGVSYMELKKWNSAISEYESAIKLALRTSDIFMPRKEWYLAEARLKMGISLVFEHRNKEAIRILTSFLGDNKNDDRTDECLFWLAEAYYRADMLKNAIDKYELVLNKYPLTTRKEEVLYGLGWSYFRLRNFKNSSKIFDRMISDYPQTEYALQVSARQADGYYIIKDYKNAARLYQRAAELSPKSEEGQYCSYQLCHALYRLGSYEKAITYLLSFVRTYSESDLAPYSLYLIGWIRFQQKNYSEAISNFEFLIKAYSNNDLTIRAHYAIGDAYYNMGEYEKAIKSYSIIVKNHPSSELATEAWRSMQYCYIALGKEEEAMKIADSVITTHPNTAFAQELFMKKADLFYSGAKYKDAVSEYESFVKSYPNSSQNDEALYWMGKSYVNLDEKEKSIEVFNSLISKYPDSEFASLAMFDKAMINKSQGEIALADSILVNIENTYPGTSIAAQSGFERAVLKFELGDTLSAINIYNIVANKYQGFEFADQARYRLASYYRSKGMNDSARYHYKIIAKNMADILLAAESQYRVGEMLMRDTVWAEAVKAFTVVRENFSGVETWYPLSLLSLGECYEKLEMKDEAINVYEALLNLNPDDEYGKTVKLRLNRLKKSK